jgi:DNA modification methylase
MPVNRLHSRKAMATTISTGLNATINRLAVEDRAVHDWYRFVLGYPAHLVSLYLERFAADPSKHIIFDPFCGTGTTPIEAKKQGFETVSFDANPMAVFATKVKTNWSVDTTALELQNKRILIRYRTKLDRNGLNLPRARVRTEKGCVKELLSPEMARVMPTGFISPQPYAKVMLLKELIDEVQNTEIRDLYRLALAAILVEAVGNIGFGPEVYMTKPKPDAPVDALFSRKIHDMLEDLRFCQESGLERITSFVAPDDARSLQNLGSHKKVDIVITSPPYPNEKDYTRSTRLESIILGFIENVEDLREIKRHLLKSNTRTIHKGDADDKYVRRFASIQNLAREIEEKRISLHKTSGFERLYHRVVTLYFGGLYRHLEALKPHMNRGGKLAYVVGDQMSFFRIHIRTGSLLAEIADSLGYRVKSIDLWRERLSTSTKLMLREEVVILEIP